MSIKVLLVDDEKLERVLIRKGFDWSANGFEVIGEAGSGKEALEFIEHRKPEMVVTDISMPHMDGLELSEKILECLPACKIVIVTGYREFDYARRAVKIGVEDFLLKPVNIAELAEITEKIKEKIVQEEAHMQEVETLKESILADKDIVMESFFQRLVENRISEEEAKRKLMMYSCEKMMQQCVCINIKIREENDGEEVIDRSRLILDMIAGQNYANTVCFVHYMKNIIMYFLCQEMEAIIESTEELHSQINLLAGVQTTIGISQENTGFQGIANAYLQSEKALSASVLLGRNKCVSYDEYQEVMQHNPDKREINWEDFMFSVSNCLIHKVEYYIQEYVELARLSGVRDIEYLRLMVLNILTKAGTTLNKYGMGMVQLIGEDQLYEEVRRINTIDEIPDYLKQNIHKIMEYHESKKVKQGNKVVGEALSYVNENIFEPELSLRLVASKIFSNESYLSRAFKKETGVTLIEYISKKRIEESIQLLNTTDMKVYEIAEKIGFRDSHYFSICFKKQTGLTIKEFRKDKYSN